MIPAISKEERKQQLIQEYLQDHGVLSTDPEDIPDELIEAAHRHAEGTLAQEGYK